MPSREPIADLEFRTHERIASIGASAWSALAGEDCPPFLRYEWLSALEDTGCIEPSRGWLAMHVAAYRAGELVAVAPAYVKGNSEGEFVFDHSWARFCHENLGADYFPKLLMAVPFTPASGPRVLFAESEDGAEVHAALSQGLARLVDTAGLSSGHVLFLPDSSAEHFERAGLCRRFGVQYHWRNAGYASFDDFLSRFSAKRRHQIRRERRELRERGIELSILSGDELGPELIDHVYEFYAITVDKHFYGRRYLNRAFFQEICARMPKQVLVVLARERGVKKPLGCAFNLVSERALFGRYWGAREERPFLHFNVCYYAGVELCIERGLQYFEPGAGGEHKHARGFESTLTHSVHYLRDPRLRAPVERFLTQERAAIVEHLQTEKPLFKPDEIC